MSSDKLNSENEDNQFAHTLVENAVDVENEGESEDAVVIASRLRAKFHSWDVGHHAELHSILQEIYAFGNRLDHDQSAHLAVVRQDYFRNNPPRPKKITAMKAAVFSTMTPITENAKDRARKYLKILDLFLKAKLDERLVVALIERCGGIQNILANLSKAANTLELASDDTEPKILPVAASSEDTPVGKLSNDMAPSESPDFDKVRSSDQALYEALTNGEPSTKTRKARATIPVDLSKDLVVDVGEAALRKSLLAVEEARSPQTYLVEVTVWPPDESGLFRVRGVFRNEIEGIRNQEGSSSKDEIGSDSAVSVGSAATVQATIPSDDGPHDETAATLVGEPVVNATLSNPVQQNQMAQSPTVEKAASSQNLNTLNELKGTGRAVSVPSNKAKPPIVVVSGRTSHNVNWKGIPGQRNPSPPTA